MAQAERVLLLTYLTADALRDEFPRALADGGIFLPEFSGAKAGERLALDLRSTSGQSLARVPCVVHAVLDTPPETGTALAFDMPPDVRRGLYERLAGEIELGPRSMPAFSPVPLITRRAADSWLAHVTEAVRPVAPQAAPAANRPAGSLFGEAPPPAPASSNPWAGIVPGLAEEDSASAAAPQDAEPEIDITIPEPVATDVGGAAPPMFQGSAGVPQLGTMGVDTQVPRGPAPPAPRPPLPFSSAPPAASGYTPRPAPAIELATPPATPRTPPESPQLALNRGDVARAELDEAQLFAGIKADGYEYARDGEVKFSPPRRGGDPKTLIGLMFAALGIIVIAGYLWVLVGEEDETSPVTDTTSGRDSASGANAPVAAGDGAVDDQRPASAAEEPIGMIEDKVTESGNRIITERIPLHHGIGGMDALEAEADDEAAAADPAKAPIPVEPITTPAADKEQARAYDETGLAAWRRGQQVIAKEFFKKALKLDPASPNANKYLSKAEREFVRIEKLAQGKPTLFIRTDEPGIIRVGPRKFNADNIELNNLDPGRVEVSYTGRDGREIVKNTILVAGKRTVLRFP